LVQCEKKRIGILWNRGDEGRVHGGAAKVRYSGMFQSQGNTSGKSGTLARRISTGEAQEMQKNSRWSSVDLSLDVGRWQR